MGNNGMLKALALATQLGFAVACPLVVFIAGGVWADNQMGTRPWLFFLGLLLGLLAAAGALYQLVVAQPTRKRDPSAGEAPDKIERGPGDVGTNRAGKARDNQ